MPNIIKTSNPPKRHTRRRVLLIVGSLLLIAAAAGGYFYWQNSQNRSSQQEEKLKKLDNDALTVEINKLVDAKKYDEAQELIKYQDDSTTDPSKIILQANMLAQQGKNDEALKLLGDAAAKKDKNQYFYTGHQARILSASDKQAALAKYTEAKELASKLEVDVKDEHAFLRKATLMADYQTEIDRLQRQQ